MPGSRVELEVFADQAGSVVSSLPAPKLSPSALKVLGDIEKWTVGFLALGVDLGAEGGRAWRFLWHSLEPGCRRGRGAAAVTKRTWAVVRRGGRGRDRLALGDAGGDLDLVGEGGELFAGGGEEVDAVGTLSGKPLTKS